MTIILRIDSKNSRIIMDKTFAKNAAVYGSNEYIQLQGARQDYPEYNVVRKTIKTNPKKEGFKGLTYEYMEKYMERYNAPSETIAEYEELRFQAACHSIRYPEIKKWFLKTFPEVKEWGKVKEKIDAAEAA